MATVYLCLVLVFLLGRQVSSQDSVPVAYPAKLLEGSGQVCPPDEQLEMARAEIRQDALIHIRTLCPGLTQENPATSCLEISQCNRQLQSQFYWIVSSNGTAIQIYCDQTRVCSCSSSSVGGWSRVAYLNMTDPTQQCPPEWREFTEPVRTCGRTNETTANGGCSSASFSTYNISYSHICGRIVGYQFGAPDAFLSFTNSRYTRIEDPFVDGVVIVRGSEKHHVWTFAAELSEAFLFSGNFVCPCTFAPNPVPIPPFVGENYFCETGNTGTFNSIFYPNDPLWDGENCGSGSTCCEFNNPPYFCQSLSEAVADDIEVRICGNELLQDEDTPIELIEIFVQ